MTTVSARIGRTIRRSAGHGSTGTPLCDRTTTGFIAVRPPLMALNLAPNTPQRRTRQPGLPGGPSARDGCNDDGQR